MGNSNFDACFCKKPKRNYNFFDQKNQLFPTMLPQIYILLKMYALRCEKTHMKLQLFLTTKKQLFPTMLPQILLLAERVVFV